MSHGRRKQAARSSQGASLSARTMAIALAVVVLVAGGALAVVQLTSSDGKQATALEGVADAKDLLAGIPVEGDTIGEPSAPALITEFADLRCPNCRAYEQRETPKVIEQLVRTGKARFRLRIWPILGPDSIAAARAAYAANRQGKLWLFAAVWYANQRDEHETYATPSFYDPIASAVGVESGRFKRDRTSSAADTWISATSTTAHAGGFGGTPTFIVEGPKGRQAATESIPDAAGLAQLVAQLS